MKSLSLRDIHIPVFTAALLQPICGNELKIHRQMEEKNGAYTVACHSALKKRKSCHLQ
jgi:hypothetical protein